MAAAEPLNAEALTTLPAALLAGCAPAYLSAEKAAAPGRISVPLPAGTVMPGSLKLSSPQFADGGAVPLEQVGSGNGCNGQNISPELDWSAAPAGTVSFVLTAYDPDAPTGSGLWHWANYNIPATATSFARGAGSAGGTVPAGTVVLNNDPGTPGYTGPCPPVGDKPHRYVFTLYALSRTLALPDGVRPPILGFNLNGATLAKASITGTYGR